MITINVRLVTKTITFQCIGGIGRCVGHSGIRMVIVPSLILQKCPVVRVYLRRPTGERLPTCFCGKTNVGNFARTAFGGDEDNAVSTTHTEESCRRSIFQDRYIVYFIGVERGNITLHTIDQNQRVLPIDGSATTHVKIGYIATGLTATLDGNQTRKTTG